MKARPFFYLHTEALMYVTKDAYDERENEFYINKIWVVTVESRKAGGQDEER